MDSDEFRIDYTIARRRDGEGDFTEVGFGSSGAWSDVDQCAHIVDSAIQNRDWETENGMPDPRGGGGPAVKTGLCRHCGMPDAPVNADGFIDRHYRADYRSGVDPENELCAGSAMGAGHLRPGELCQHHGIPSPNCRSVLFGGQEVRRGYNA